MPTNVEVLVSYEELPNATATSNTIAFQHLDFAYGNLYVFSQSADPIPTTTNLRYLITAGGGGGGGPNGAGGGGGGLAYSDNIVTTWNAVYSVVVGASGVTGASNGGGSSISGPNISVSLTGGGGTNNSPTTNGQPGGSGGGGGNTPGPGYGTPRGGGTGIPGQGNPGGPGGGYINTGGGGGGFTGGGGGAWAYFGGGGGGGFGSNISGQSNVYSQGGRGAGDGGGQSGGPDTQGHGGGSSDQTGKGGVAYFSYPAPGKIGTGGSNIYLADANNRVHQFTTSGTFQLPNPPLFADGTILRAAANSLIKVNMLRVANFNNANVRCNVWYRDESANNNTYIIFNQLILANTVLLAIDKNKPIYIANTDALVGSYQTGSF